MKVVTKGDRGHIFVCMRCGAAILLQDVHDEWHDTNDRYEQAIMNFVVKFLPLFEQVSQDLHPL